MTTQPETMPPLSERIRYFVGELMRRATTPGPNGDPDLELGSLAIALSMLGDTADREIAQLTQERDLAVAHDRQPYPTAWAYEQACKARTRHQERADALATVLGEVLAQFTQAGHPGAPCLRTPWIRTPTVERWRAALAPPVPADTPEGGAQ